MTTSEQDRKDSAETRRNIRLGEAFDGSTALSRTKRRADWNKPSKRSREGTHDRRWNGVDH